MSAEQKCVALVGRPNVGKSRLFNRLLGRRVSIVHDQPGVTRDVLAEPLGENILLMDTGGMFADLPEVQKVIADATDAQANFAINAADVIIFVVDARESPTESDLRLADILRRSGKPVIVAANKADTPSVSADDYYALGFADVAAVSAEHGIGIEKITGFIEKFLGKIVPCVNVREEGLVYLCAAGRPNVGKSSVCNRLLGSDKLIVSPVAGTTRDCVWHDISFKSKKGAELDFRLYDTAGIRTKRKVNTSLDFLSGVRTRNAIENSDIVFLIIDALEGVSELDKKLAGEILQEGASIMIVVNKWDKAAEVFKRGALKGYKNLESFKKGFEAAVRKELFFLADSPVHFVSALENKGMESLLEGAAGLYKRMLRPISTGKVNSVLQRLLEENPPAHIGGKRFKIYYAVKTSTRPLTFKIFCNKASILTKTYQRYLENGLRREFKLGGISLMLDLVGKKPRAPRGSGGER